MKFRDETERAAWSSAWDAGRLAGLAPVFCAEGANDKIEAMRERQEPQPPRSERGALARIRKRMVESTWDDGRQIPYDEGRALAIHLIDAELARQPADELSPRVKAVVEAARAWVKSLHTDFEAESALCQAVKALDKETK